VPSSVRAEHGHGIARVGPVVHQQSEVGQRIAQSADLPVEDGPDGPVVGQHDVVHPVVAVDHGRPLLFGDAPGQLVAHTLDDATVVDTFDLHLLVLPAPALELALYVPLVPTQIAQSDRIGVDGVQRSQRVRHVTADPAPGRLVECGLGLGALRRM